jgi:hypothetical protein
MARRKRQRTSLTHALHTLVHATADPCLLCGNPPAWRGIFVPTRPEAWGAPPGKQRLIGYWLCASCRALPAVAALALARIMATLAGHKN